jgi:uncharacterized protein
LKRSRSAKAPLRIRFDRSRGAIVRITVTGHAGFAHAGEDIVCAAVSALVQTAANGVSAYCGAVAQVHDEPDGDYVLGVPGGGGAKAQAVLETTVAGLRAIARSYPGHVSLRGAGK